jgi:hypothetical protein
VNATTTRNPRTSLWEKATALPDAKDGDFFGPHRRPAGVEAQYLKIINDTSLRTRLIDSGIAEGLQSPKGPQKIPSIIRLYPNFDAPAKDAPQRNGRAAQPARTAFGLPTVEDLGELLARISRAEVEVGEKLAAQVNADINRLKRALGDLEGDELERTFRELDRALTTRRALARQVREDAFRAVESDAAFEPRKFLRLISREPRE